MNIYMYVYGRVYKILYLNNEILNFDILYNRNML